MSSCPRLLPVVHALHPPPSSSPSSFGSALSCYPLLPSSHQHPCPSPTFAAALIFDLHRVTVCLGSLQIVKLPRRVQFNVNLLQQSRFLHMAINKGPVQLNTSAALSATSTANRLLLGRKSSDAKKPLHGESTTLRSGVKRFPRRAHGTSQNFLFVQGTNSGVLHRNAPFSAVTLTPQLLLVQRENVPAAAEDLTPFSGHSCRTLPAIRLFYTSKDGTTASWE